MIALLTVAALLVICTDANAQNRSDRYTITVDETEGGCQYQIQDQANQDLFSISPSGVLTVRATAGLWVDVTIEDDLRGTPGTQRERFAVLREENGNQNFAARSAIGRSTEHKVRIECCPGRSGRNECPQWVEASAPSMGATGSVMMDPPVGTGRGPSAENRASATEPPGGPIMRVDEN